MKLRTGWGDGTEKTVDATERTLAAAVGEPLDFLICEADDGRFMQHDGEHLEYGEPFGDRVSILRAHPDDVRGRGALPALVSFLRGDEQWRTLYRWEDVSDEVVEDIRRARLRYALVCLVIAAVAAWTWYRVIREA